MRVLLDAFVHINQSMLLLLWLPLLLLPLVLQVLLLLLPLSVAASRAAGTDQSTHCLTITKACNSSVVASCSCMIVPPCTCPATTVFAPP
jgi:hypothetical protein